MSCVSVPGDSLVRDRDGVFQAKLFLGRPGSIRLTDPSRGREYFARIRAVRSEGPGSLTEIHGIRGRSVCRLLAFPSSVLYTPDGRTAASSLSTGSVLLPDGIRVVCTSTLYIGACFVMFRTPPGMCITADGAYIGPGD